MKEKEKISTQELEDSDAWDTGELGQDAQYAKVSDEDIEAIIDESLELVPISVRLQKSLIDDLKIIGEIYGIGYQPLLRQILCRFAESEKKKILNEKLAAQRHAAEKARQQQEELATGKHRKRA